MSLYNIYDPERRAFWSPNRTGYTAVQSEAGIYSEEEADEICDSPYTTDHKVPVEVELKSEWIEVSCYKDVPKGVWLVKLDVETGYNPYQVMDCQPTGSSIGHHFAFDEERVIAYKSLGELL